MRSLHTLLAGIIKEAREETLYQISLGVKPNGTSGTLLSLELAAKYLKDKRYHSCRQILERWYRSWNLCDE